MEKLLKKLPKGVDKNPFVVYYISVKRERTTK
jgi:hypothetical protein